MALFGTTMVQVDTIAVANRAIPVPRAPTMTSAIIRTHYRYKRPPRKRKAVALGVPVIVTRAAKRAKRGVAPKPEEPVAMPPAEDDRKSAIVTVRRKGRAVVPDLTPEEHLRRADAADAIFQEMKRRIAEKDRS